MVGKQDNSVESLAMVGKHFLGWLALDDSKRNFGELGRCFLPWNTLSVIPSGLSFWL